jgi:hypothetical protein
MAEEKFKIVFTGKIFKGFKIEDVKKRISSIFKMPPEKVEKLFKGKPVTVKKNLDLDKARKYSKAFKKAGAVCTIAVQGERGARETRNPGFEVPKPAVGTMTCPSCGHKQKKAPDCAKCGIIISKYKERSEREEDDSVLYNHEEPRPSPRRSLIGPGIIFSLLALCFAIYLGFSWYSNRPIVHGPGPVAPDQPSQEATDKEMFRFKEYRIYPLAEYHIRARVLSKKKYYLGREADLSPVDLALGWGRMSDEKVLESIKIKQSGRFYFWSTKRFPIPRKEIERNSANTHIIPADEVIEDELGNIREGHIVDIQGYLVRVNAEDGWRWKSSVTRNDTGAGACEVLFAEYLEVQENL